MQDRLREVQLVQLEMLKVIDKICSSNNLRYSLYGGTLIGAVRHGGFIPWDDDLDVCMSRKDYEKFLQIWASVKPEGYVLQNKENSPQFTQSFTKIRKEHTTFLQFENEVNKYHTGIFVDIFPMDRIPNGKRQCFLFKANCMVYQLFTREFVPPKANGVVKVVSKGLLFFVSKKKREKVRRKALKNITKYSQQKELKVVGIETAETLKFRFSPDLLEQYIYLPFEDGEFMCFKDWHNHLKIKYGDYMKLPPIQERTWKHHPIILDFEHDYNEVEENNGKKYV